MKLYIELKQSRNNWYKASDNELIKERSGYFLYDYLGDIKDLPYAKDVSGKLELDEDKKTTVESAEKEALNKAQEISVLKAELKKVKEDVEQESFGLIRNDFPQKKARAAEIINEIREYEGKLPREVTDVYNR